MSAPNLAGYLTAIDQFAAVMSALICGATCDYIVCARPPGHEGACGCLRTGDLGDKGRPPRFHGDSEDMQRAYERYARAERFRKAIYAGREDGR